MPRIGVAVPLSCDGPAPSAVPPRWKTHGSVGVGSSELEPIAKVNPGIGSEFSIPDNSKVGFGRRLTRSDMEYRWPTTWPTPRHLRFEGVFSDGQEMLTFQRERRQAHQSGLNI